MNESLAALSQQALSDWQVQAAEAATHFAATHILTMRAGALLDPGTLPGIRYAPVEGNSLLKTLLRAKVLSDREAGKSTSREELLAQALEEGMTLAGFALSAAMVAQLETAVPPRSPATGLAQSAVGGAGLWLRSEPGHDAEQAAKLAKLTAQATA